MKSDKRDNFFRVILGLGFSWVGLLLCHLCVMCVPSEKWWAVVPLLPCLMLIVRDGECDMKSHACHAPRLAIGAGGSCWAATNWVFSLVFSAMDHSHSPDSDPSLGTAGMNSPGGYDTSAFGAADYRRGFSNDYSNPSSNDYHSPSDYSNQLPSSDFPLPNSSSSEYNNPPSLSSVDYNNSPAGLSTQSPSFATSPGGAQLNSSDFSTSPEFPSSNFSSPSFSRSPGPGGGSSGYSNSLDTFSYPPNVSASPNMSVSPNLLAASAEYSSSTYSPGHLSANIGSTPPPNYMGAIPGRCHTNHFCKCPSKY